MKDTIVQVEGLYKQYRFGVVNRGIIFQDLRRWWRKKVSKENLTDVDNYAAQVSQAEDKGRFWALQDVSFEVKRGEVLGIIGKNGAGKSTLLKILSMLTAPTKGAVKLDGRTASLLEIGTGFHPELTGRENVYLNGAILGMTKKEIDRKFDEIVDFAGVEAFLETPVKRYSSGMYVRLAFAVAAHLESEVLIVDEVLAVGDLFFQRKCLGTIREAGRQGRTILFVSHGMSNVEELCDSAILLENGRVKSIGKDVASVIKDYVFVPEADGLPAEWRASDPPEHVNDYFTPLAMYLSNEAGEVIRDSIRNDSVTWINIVGEARELDPTFLVGYQVYSENGVMLYGSAHWDGPRDKWPVIRKGINHLRSRLPQRFLNEGVFRIELSAGIPDGQYFFYPGRQNPMFFFEIKGGLSESPAWTTKRLGLLAPVFEWTNR